jgi:hypothetical protein
MQSHSKAVPLYVCNACKYAFASEAEIEIHMLVHPSSLRHFTYLNPHRAQPPQPLLQEPKLVIS